MTSLLLVSLIDTLSKGHVIAGIVLAIIGLALALIARRLVIALNKGRQVASTDTRVIVWKSVGLGLILVGLLVISIPLLV